MYLAKLTIYRVGVDDVGKYRCVSSNGFGYSTATLAIIGKKHLPFLLPFVANKDVQ